MHIKVTIVWNKQPEEKFTDHLYSRTHQWVLEGGTHISASSSPHVVPIPMSDPSLLDPEEAFLASISSCHMLFFLSIAAKKKYIVDCYEDHPEGVLSKNKHGKMAFTSVILHPKVIFSSKDIPSNEDIHLMHIAAHSNCFIANSIQAKISIKPKL